MTKRKKLDWRKFLIGDEVGALAMHDDFLMRVRDQYRTNTKSTNEKRKIIINRAIKRMSRARDKS